MSDFIYLYGFVPADASPPARLSGIADRAVDVVDAGVHAAISRVPSDVYAPSHIEPRLKDLQWVAQQGVAHETVVAWFVDHSEILPVPLFTMYSSETALRDAVSLRAQEVLAELMRLKNKREWDVKISFDERVVEQHAGALSDVIASLENEIAAATPGKRYLLERKRSDLLKGETRKAAHAIAQDVVDTVKPHSVETRTLPIPRVDEDLPVILHAAFLVDRASEPKVIEVLEQEKRRLDPLGLGLTFSGPWAPYRFAGDHERAAAGEA